MGEKFMKSTSNLAVAIAAGLFMTAAPMSASAADLGGNCCADLEERVAELEASTVRKGNRKMSLSLSGHINRAMLIWSAKDNGASDSDIYSVGNHNSQSRFRMKGSAKIGGGWSAGFLLEYWVGDTLSGTTTQNNDDGANDGNGLKLYHDVIFVKNKQLGTFYMGHSSDSTDGISEIDLSGTKVVNKFSASQLWNGSFTTNGGNKWSSYARGIDGFTGKDAVIRYDTPTFAGFTASGTFGEDDVWSAALRYANEFGGVLRVAAGVGYAKIYEEELNTAGSTPAVPGNTNNDNGADGPEVTQLSGSVSAMHVPTGLNVSFSMGETEKSTVANAKDSYWHVKAGIKQKWTAMGATALYGEYASYDMNNVATANAGTEATMWGLGVVQKIDAAAMEIYAAYRVYDLDTVADNSWSGAMVGARIKF